jgi:2,4-dienoyl-CoA reductase-like NADH-dependent reductase (Old Yellow Enzyme family)
MFMPKLYKLTEAVHNEGGLIAVQINHAGASASSARTGVPTVSSSTVPSKLMHFLNFIQHFTRLLKLQTTAPQEIKPFLVGTAFRSQKVF